MLTIIIFMIIGIVITLFVAYDGIKDLVDMVVFMLMCVMGASVGAIAGVLIAIAIPSNTKTVIDTHYLEALQDNNSVSGRFFLGSGNINGEMKYVFYYKKNGGYKMNQLSYDKVLVKYTNKAPRIETHKEVQTDAFINKFSILPECEPDKNIIYVPKGTIKQNYNLDAQ